MASVSLARGRTDVTEKQVNITITANGFYLPDDTASTKYDDKQYQYSLDDDSWKNMSSNSIKITFFKINNELHRSITIYCRIKYTINHYEKVEIKNDKGEVIDTKWEFSHSTTGVSKSASESINIYFHPGVFNMGATVNPDSSNNIIKNVLTAEKINDEWIPHFQAAYHWYNQKPTDYGPANTTYSSDNPEGMKVVAGQPIYAEWFNNCMLGMEQFDKEVDKVERNDLIEADLINQMNFSGTQV